MKIILRIFLIITVSSFIIYCGNPNKKSTINEEFDEKHDPTTFEVLATNHFPSAENFYVLIKLTDISKEELQKFVDMFRKEYCTIQCNIELYDDALVKALVTKYPLSDEEYLKIADHCVAMSSFDVIEIWMYPYQDTRYKELVGKNRKNE